MLDKIILFAPLFVLALLGIADIICFIIMFSDWKEGDNDDK